MVSSKLSMILTDEELHRIHVSKNTDDELMIIAVVHGMTCGKVRKFINNIINVVRAAFQLVIIHGYTHGTAIKDMLANDFDNNHICDRYADSFNYGVTHLLIAA